MFSAQATARQILITFQFLELLHISTTPVNKSDDGSQI